MKILYVEDEKYMARAVAQILKKHNYSVDLAHDGEDGLDQALTDIYDIIILDIMLPKINGIEILKSLRKNKITAPIILLTAKGETEDKVSGLDSGADDYLAKPFESEELMARLRALSRRHNFVLSDNILRYCDIEFNPNTLDLYCGKNSFRLTLKEGQLLELLIKNIGIKISSSTIIEKLWGYDTETEDRHVQVHIAFLRKKLTLLSSKVKIQNIRGVGYILNEEKE